MAPVRSAGEREQSGVPNTTSPLPLEVMAADAPLATIVSALPLSAAPTLPDPATNRAPEPASVTAVGALAPRIVSPLPLSDMSTATVLPNATPPLAPLENCNVD